MKTPTKTCAWCGKTFRKKVTTSRKDWREAKFCSRLCYWRAKVKPPSHTCPQCGELFKPHNWMNKAKYCSRKCSVDSRRKPLPTCEVCGKTCKAHDRRFCSPECKKVWYTGENVYNYLGPEGPWRSQLAFYTSAFWKKQCKKARKRDKVCQRCGTKSTNGIELDVHHIIPRRVNHDDSLSNLQTLCPSCHPIVEAEARKEFPNSI